MKKISYLLALFFLFTTNCGVEINGKDVASWSSQPDQVYFDLCNMHFLFDNYYDTTVDDYIWHDVYITNKEDRTARVIIKFQANGGIALDETFWAREKDAHCDIYIDNGTKITVDVWHWGEGGWNACSQSGTVYKLD